MRRPPPNHPSTLPFFWMLPFALLCLTSSQVSGGHFAGTGVSLEFLQRHHRDLHQSFENSGKNLHQSLTLHVPRYYATEARIALHLISVARRTEKDQDVSLEFLAFFIASRRTWIEVNRMARMASLHELQASYLECNAGLLDASATLTVSSAEAGGGEQSAERLLADFHRFAWEQLHFAMLVEELWERNTTTSSDSCSSVSLETAGERGLARAEPRISPQEYQKLEPMIHLDYVFKEHLYKPRNQCPLIKNKRKRLGTSKCQRCRIL